MEELQTGQIRHLNVAPKKIREFLAKGNLRKAAIAMLSLVEKNEDFRNEAILISYQIHTLERALIGGRMPWQEEVQGRNQLAARLLLMLDMVETDKSDDLTMFGREKEPT